MTQTLSPRVQILPAPYAQFAAVAATVTNGAIMNAELAGNAVNTTNIQNGAVTTLQIANGAVGSAQLASNLTVSGTLDVSNNLQIGGTLWSFSVGNFTGPTGTSYTNVLLFSANATQFLAMVDVPGYGPYVMAANGLGAERELDTTELKVKNTNWNSVVDIDSSGDINASGNISCTSLVSSGIILNPAGGISCASLVSGGNIHANGSISANGDICGGTFCGSSDRNLKEKFAPIDDQEILERVASLPISRWNFKTDGQTRHIGPMAQDFYAAFNVGPDDKHIATVDEGGVALAAIQGLNAKLKEKEAEIAEMKARLEKLEQIINAADGGVK